MRSRIGFLLLVAIWGITSPARALPRVETTRTATAIEMGRVGSPPPGIPGGRGVRNSIEEWWGRTKRALHHLTGCTLASAGITYAFIVGVTIPGAGLLGLAGAGAVVLMCL